MAVQNDDLFAGFGASFFNRWLKSSSSPANNSLLKPPIFLNAEVSQKMKEAGHVVEGTAYKIPQPGKDLCKEVMLIQPHGGASCNAFAGTDMVCDIAKKLRAGMGICIHENEPSASGERGAAISRAGNLVDRLENDGCARGARDIGGIIVGIIVANNQFGVPADVGEGGGCGFNLGE